MNNTFTGITFHKKDVLQAGKFIAGLTILFFTFNFLLGLVPLEFYEFFYAFFTLEFLKIIGFEGFLEFNEPVLVYLVGIGLPLGFTYLCTGLLEMSLVWSAVLSSFGIDLRKRIIGLGIGTLILVGFNFVRIIASILIIAWFGLNAGNFSHDLLFRVFLFITIAGFYFYWFKYATKK